MAKVDVKFGRTSIKAILETYGEKAVTAAREALEENAEIVVEEAKLRCPVSSEDKERHLRDSIHSEWRGKNKIRIVADAQNERDGYYYGNLLEFAPDSKYAFLRPALEAKRDELKQNIINKIRDALKN